MDDSPRSSKRRKLDTPTRNASTPLVNSTLRKSSRRLASHAGPALNGGSSEAQDDAATPVRKSSRRVASTPNGAVNGSLRKRGAAADESSVYDDIDGALPSRGASPAPAPKSTKPTPRRREKFVLDSSLPHPFKRNFGSAAQKRSATTSAIPDGSASRSSVRNLGSGHKHTNPGAESELQDELAETATPTKRAKTTRAAKGTEVSPTKGRGSASAKTTGRATRGQGLDVEREESIDQLQTNGVQDTPSKGRSTRKAVGSANGTRLAAAKIESADPLTATPSRSSKRRGPVSDSEDELGDRAPPSRTTATRDRRRAHCVDHTNNEDDILVESEGGEEEDTAAGAQEDEADVDGDSIVGSVLDPTEPSPFNKPSPAEKAEQGVPLLQGNLPSGRELDLLKAIVMERITGKRPVPLVELDEEYRTVYGLIEHTITAGEGNSMLLIGARGSGKTSLVNKVLSEVSKDNSEEYHVVRLNGFIHTDDKIALREIWRQLGKEMDVEDDGGLGKNYADTLTTLLALLSHPDEHSGEYSEKVAKAVIFIMDEFDLFAQHPRQTLLYNLFDIAQSRKAPIAVLGLTTRIDVVDSLEKRVKSRFSHRYVHLSLAKTFTSFQEMCKAALVVRPEQLSVEERSILSSETALTPAKGRKNEKTSTTDILTEWNKQVSVLFASKAFLTTHLAPTFYHTKSIPSILSSFLAPISHLQSTPLCPTSLLEAPQSKLSLLPSLSTLGLALLISAARLDIIHDSDTCNFNMAYDEYVTLASKARIQSAAGGISSSGSVSKVWGKEAGRREWEGLVELGLLMPVLQGRAGGFDMVKVDVALEEIGEVLKGDKNVEKALERWCRQL